MEEFLKKNPRFLIYLPRRRALYSRSGSRGPRACQIRSCTSAYTGIAPKPVIPNPPTVGVVRIRAVAVPVVVALVRVLPVAVREVFVVVLRISPSCLRHDPAEPALLAAVDGAIEEGRLLALLCARRLERPRAFSARLRWRLSK